MTIEHIVKSLVSDLKTYTDPYALIAGSCMMAVLGYIMYKDYRKNKSDKKT